MSTSAKRRYSMTEEQGKIVKSSLLFTYAVLSNLTNEELGAKVDKEYLNSLAEAWEAIAKYKWEKEVKK